MGKILTIVIPSYNTENHIDKCLPTMIREDFASDIEILLINDGSTDNTQKLLEKYAEHYPETIRVINKENGGHGSVINRGITEASGKYFRVIDGDDYVITDNLKKLVDLMKTTPDVDLICTPFYEEFVQSGNRVVAGEYAVVPGKILEFDIIASEMSCIALHAINYRTEMLKENNIKVQEKCFYEDREYNMFPIPHIHRILYYDFPVYVYELGVSGQSISLEKVVKNWKMLKVITKNLCEFYEREVAKGISHPKRDYLSRSICDVIKNTYGMFLKMSHGRDAAKLISEFNAECKEWSPKLYKEGDSGVVKLLRMDNYIIYSTVYVAFKRKRKKRGF